MTRRVTKSNAIRHCVGQSALQNTLGSRNRSKPGENEASYVSGRFSTSSHRHIALASIRLSFVIWRREALTQVAWSENQ